MPNVAMPDGTVVGFPDAMPPDQIKGLIASKFPDVAQQATAPNPSNAIPAQKDPGLFGSIGAAYQKRAVQMQDSADAYVAGEQTMPETVVQQALDYGQLLPDTVAATAKAGFNSLPATAQNAMKTAGSYASSAYENSPFGYAARPVEYAAHAAEQAYGNLEQTNPRAARNVRAGGDALNLLAAVAPIKGQSAAGAVGELASNTVGGIIPDALSNIKSTRRVSLAGVDPDQALINAVEPVQQNYQKVLHQENQLFNDARSAGENTNVSGGVVNGISQRVEKSLNDSGKSLADDDLRPLAQQLSKLDKFKGEAVSVDATGELPKVSPANDAPLSQIIAIRRGISGIAGNAQDGTLRNAAGTALKEFDAHLNDNLEKAVMSGNEDAITKYADAVRFSKQKYNNFGTNTSAGQKNTFENIITKNAVDNVQLVDAFGTTTRGNQGTSQFVTRLLDNAGDQRDVVRKNLANGYIYRAIRRSTHTIEGGEDIVDPTRFRTELNRLVSEDRASGGMGGEMRNKVFSPDEVKSLLKLRDGLKDPRNLLGVARQMGMKLPIGADRLFTKPQVAAGRSTRNLVQKYLTDFANQASPQLKGEPTDYSGLVSRAAVPVATTKAGKRQ